MSEGYSLCEKGKVNASLMNAREVQNTLIHGINYFSDVSNLFQCNQTVVTCLSPI